VHWLGDPRSAFGQRDVLSVPRADVSVYMHQVRPLRGGRSLTFVHDTIPLRHGGRLPVRLAKRAFFAAVVRRSTRIATVSQFSRVSIARDLGVAPVRIAVLPVGAGVGRPDAVRRLRAQLGQQDVLVYVGRFLQHKNLARLLTAFERSAFGRAGGRLVLVGGEGDEVKRLRRLAASRAATIDVRGTCSEDELDLLLATSRALVLPSLEEGFGLPAYEAAASGLPVAASATGALTELPPGTVELLDPHDVDDMAQAIDLATRRPPHEGVSVSGDLSAAFLVVLASCFHA
jgi:glycosyltransferase involved in cell wall biosynthesis